MRQLQSETKQARAAYELYASMPDRSYSKLAELLKKPPSYKRMIALWASQFEWQARIVEYDLAQRDKARAQRDADEAARHQRQIEREKRREAQRAKMDDQRAQVFEAQWAMTLKLINERLGIGPNAKPNAKPNLRGLVGLVALVKLSLDEQVRALGGDVGNLDLTSIARGINSAAGIAMAREIMANLQGDANTRDAVALALLAEAQADATTQS